MLTFRFACTVLRWFVLFTLDRRLCGWRLRLLRFLLGKEVDLFVPAPHHFLIWCGSHDLLTKREVVPRQGGGFVREIAAHLTQILELPRLGAVGDGRVVDDLRRRVVDVGAVMPLAVDHLANPT